MYILLRLCLLVLVVTEGVYGIQCNDCMRVDLCPKALDLLKHAINEEITTLLRNSACGFDTLTPKVCCSMLANKEEDMRITNHKNLNLLPEDCGNIKGDKIFGGTIADLYEFPWMALIAHRTRYDDAEFRCGGSIISQRYILTAAHCVKDNAILAGIRVGEYDITTDIDCQKNICEPHIQNLQIERVIIHEDYVPSRKGFNDIALLRVNTDIDFNYRNVHRICLPTTSQLLHEDLSNRVATVTGWGTTENLTDASVLRKVKVPIVPPENCTVILSRFSPGDVQGTRNQICAGVSNKDSCRGDSGGPLMIEQERDNVFRLYQYGVVSHGSTTCGSSNPAAYVDIRKYMGWILDNLSP